MEPVPSAVTVVIPVRDDADGLPRAVASVLRQHHPGDLEVLLVVGPSEDATEAVADRLAAEHDRVRVIENPTGTIPAALNLGLAAATGEILVRVDARAELPPDYIAHAVETLEATGAANVGAVQVPVGRTPVQRAIAAAMASRAGSGGVAYRRATRPQRVDTGFLGVFDVERLRAAGGWDGRFLRNEDAELNLRLAAHGGVWLDPRLVVHYAPRSTLTGLARQYFDYGWWRRATVAKHPGSLALRQIAAPLLVVFLVLALLLALVWPATLLVVAAYLVLLLAAAFAADRDDANPVLVAAALGVIHLCWGTGFLLSSLRTPGLVPDQPSTP